MKKYLLIGSMAAIFMVGCATQGTDTQTEGDSVQADINATLADANMTAADALQKANDLSKILFGFDKYDISDNMLNRVELDAKVIKAADLKVRLEGNTDAFGSDEYNYALGTKRANAVKDALVVRGVNAANISLVSYGESKPVCEEKTKDCYQQNRRVEFVVLPK